MTLEISPDGSGESKVAIKHCQIKYVPGDTGIHLTGWPPRALDDAITYCTMDCARVPEGASIILVDLGDGSSLGFANGGQAPMTNGRAAT